MFADRSSATPLNAIKRQCGPTLLIVYSRPVWDSSAGIRKLEGKERALFIEGLLSLHDHLRLDGDDDGLPLDIPAFDDTTLTDRLSVLVFVADQVLSNGPPPKGFAWNEAAKGRTSSTPNPLSRRRQASLSG